MERFDAEVRNTRPVATERSGRERPKEKMRGCLYLIIKNNVELIPIKKLLKLIYILIKLISMTNNIELGSAPLGKLMAKLAIPSITAFVINILYNIVDRTLILPLFFGVDGIFWAETIASMSSAITSGILLFFCYKKLK